MLRKWEFEIYDEFCKEMDRLAREWLQEKGLPEDYFDRPVLLLDEEEIKELDELMED